MSFKIGDHIKKIINGVTINDAIYKIKNINIIDGGNWHDGYTTSFVATIAKINADTTININIFEEYCLQYTNYMCQINNKYAVKII